MDHLTRLKIRAETINSKMTESERKRVINDLYSVQVSTSLLYVTPEQAATDFFKVGIIYFVTIQVQYFIIKLKLSQYNLISGFIILFSTKK